MSWLQDHWLVFLMLVGYTGVMAYNAMVGRRRTHGMADYYVGGRAMGGVAIGLSFFATYSSTNSFVGFAGQSYLYGAPWLLLAPGIVLFSFLAWVWVAPRLRRFTASLDSVTLPDFIGFRYGSTPARVIAAAIVLFASFLYMTAVFKGIGNLLETFLDIPYGAAIVIVFFIVMVYTAVGGFISVVRTDVIQGIIMVFSAFLLFGGTVQASGGIGTFFDVRNQPEGLRLFSWEAAMPLPVLLGIIVAASIKFIVEPRQLSRFYALADKKAVRTGVWVSTLTFVVVYSMLIPIGIYARNILPHGIRESDHVVPRLLSDGAVFTPLVSSFLLVAMVAAAMSSLDSVLLVMASTCERDLVGVWRRPSSEALVVRATRRYVALFALVTAIIALDPPGTIVDLTAFSGSLYAACFFPAIAFGLHWRRGSGASVITSFVAGMAVLVFWKYLPFAGAIHQLFPAMALSIVSYLLLASLTPANQAGDVQALFDERDRTSPSRG
jgi:SSS family transporter